jgi:hypothetical protein
VERVVARRAEDAIERGAIAGVVRVAGDVVVARATVEPVVALDAEDRVVPGAGEDAVVAAAADEAVVAAAALDVVVARVAVDEPGPPWIVAAYALAGTRASAAVAATAALRRLKVCMRRGRSSSRSVVFPLYDRSQVRWGIALTHFSRVMRGP